MPSLRLSKSGSACFALVAALTACSAPGAVSNNPPAQTVDAQSAMTNPPAASSTLFVANTGSAQNHGSVTVYGAKSGKLQRA